MRQHRGWRSQQYAWSYTSVGSGRCHVILVQLQPANQQQLRQPEDLLHRNALLDNGNSLQPEQFKIRHVRSNTIDEDGQKQSRNPPFLFEKQSAICLLSEERVERDSEAPLNSLSLLLFQYG